MINIGLSSGSIKLEKGTILDSLELIREAGFNLVEADANNSNTFPFHSTDFVEALAAKSLETGVVIGSVHSPFNASIADPDRDTRSYAVGQILLLMRNLIPLIRRTKRRIKIVIHPGHHLDRTPVHEQFHNCLESIREVLESHLSGQYDLCIENMLSSHFGSKSQELLALLENLKGENISICLDTSHAVYDSNPMDMLEELYPYITTAHISDNYHQSDGEFHAIPMSLIHSKIRWPEFFQMLASRVPSVVLELKKPAYLENDIFLSMAALSAEQIYRFIS